MTVSSPIVLSASMTVYGPTCAPAPRTAVGCTTAVGWMMGGAPTRSASGTTILSHRQTVPRRDLPREIDVQAVAGTIGDHARAQRPAEQRKISDRVEDLVAGEL